ncbi:DNA mismatch repair protein Msh2 [Agrilus planipennis]|uniref:DNA mismatch repair protein Msh2 n=1 Tax=Agrilus planipennis TaxID=224129 RepID=A0A1W4XGX3_AGRPL|nr:DNA mismatch repair protein Msh2 [Agrilus planipennis]
MTNLEPVHALNLDLPQQQSFVRFYESLPKKPASTVRFFSRTDYYTVHGEDAVFATQELFSTHPIKYMGETPKLSYLVLSINNFEKFIRELLLVKQYRVEIYVKPKEGKNNDWVLKYKGSPGNLSQFEDILFENNQIAVNSCVIGVKIFKNKMLAVSCVNITEGQFQVCEFNDNEFFTELEALLAQVSPKEAIIPSADTGDLKNLQKVLERNGVLVVKAKKNDFNDDDFVQDLNRLLYFDEKQQRNALAFSETSLKEAMGSLQAVVRYLNLIADEQNYNQFRLSMLDLRRYVRLDNAAVYGLNLLPQMEQRGFSKKTNSILGMLDSCLTVQGRRLLEQWVRQPPRDMNIITERLEIVHALVENSEFREVLRANHLSQIPDLLILSKKMVNKKTTLRDLYRVYQAANHVPGLVNSLRKCENKYVNAVLADPIAEFLVDMEKFQSMIEQTIDLDLVDRGEYFLKPTFDEKLGEIHDKKQRLEEKIQKVFRRACDELNMEKGKGVKLECNDQHGYHFRVTLKEESSLRKQKSFQIIDSLNKGVRFTNEKLSEINERYMELNKEYEDVQKNLVKEIIDVAAGYADTLRNLNHYMAKVDVLVSFATVAATAPIPFVKPKLLKEGSGVLRLKKVRHPCLELQDGVTFIPNDTHFKDGQKNFYIITGPNMGGKSTYIKSVGVCVLLAHIGSLVPCAEAEISLVDCILMRVGSDDSQLKGLSTFMLEMVETTGLVRSATSNSLVIIDELGRGTSTYDGFGIAWAIAEHLAKEVRCFSLYATHFHEITHLAEMIPAVHNVHVTAVTTETTITPLYQVREGVCDRSYGIHCAKMADFPRDVVEDAAKYLEELENSNGMKYIRDYEFSLKKKEIQEGDELINEFLSKCRQLNVSELSDEELIASVQKLKEEILKKNNMFVKGLMNL